MVVEFVSNYARLIATLPYDIRVVEKTIDDNCIEIILFCNDADLGRLIGKNGKMINAIRTMINGYKAKDNKSYKLTIEQITKEN